MGENLRYSADTDWEKRDETTTRYKVRLDVALMMLAREGKISPLVAPDILQNRETVRENIVRVLIERVFPQMATDMARDGRFQTHIPQSHLRTESRVRSAVGSDFSIQGNALAGNHTIESAIEIKASRNVNAAIAFYNSRDVIAHNIASAIVQNVKAVYGNDKSPERVENESKTDGDKVLQFQSRRVPLSEQQPTAQPIRKAA